MSPEQLHISSVECPTGMLRRFEGQRATELFLVCRPEVQRKGDIVQQTASVYHRLCTMLRHEGAVGEHVVQETVFFRHIRDRDLFRQVRRRVLGELGFESFQPGSMCVEQPPLTEEVQVEVCVHAIVPHYRQRSRAWNVWSAPPCGCEPCGRTLGYVSVLGEQKHLRTGNIYGAPGGAFEETYSMFSAAEDLLRQEGMTFRDVVRTWIYLREIDRDYDEFNRARRAFFKQTGISILPASTGINGAPFAEEHNLSMSLHAIKSSAPLALEVMTTPTLNEAWMYGSDFSRGLRVVEANKITLYVSGTASVDEEGRTAHVGDFEGQVGRMITNVETLLAAQHASVGDLVSVITYVKDPTNAPRLRAMFRDRGLADVPNAIVKAHVCRPNLLCEMEAIAALAASGESE